MSIQTHAYPYRWTLSEAQFAKDKGKVPLSEVASLWIEHKAELVKRSTLLNYMLLLRKHILPTFGHLTHIEEYRIQDYIIHRMKEGVSKKMVKDIVATTKMIARWGHKRHMYPEPDWLLYFPVEERASRKPQVLSLSSHRRLCAYLSESPTPQNIGIFISLSTGMRIGEVLALEWDDVDLVGRTITVRRTACVTYDVDSGATERFFSTPKTQNSFREVPISPQLYQALCRVKRQSPTSFVVGKMGKPLDGRSYRDTFARVLKRLRIPHIVFHGLRHTFATRCIESGCDVKTVSNILGHANVAITLNLYVHPNLEQKRKAIDKMSRLIYKSE